MRIYAWRAALLTVLLPLTAGATAEVVDTTRVYGMNEVVVTGTNHALDRNLLPYTVTTVSGSQLEASGQTQLLSALSGEVPSLFVTQRNVFGFGVSNGGSGGIKIRGVGGSPTNAILMMVDGQPQFAGLYSHPVADFYETEYVERVEVMRGPGSVLYGSNAMGGVINVITKQAQTDGVETTLTSQYGSYDTWQTSLTNRIRKGRFSSLVSLGYDCTDGTEKHFDFRQKSLYAKLGYELTTHWNVNADYMLMHFVGNDPIYARLKDAESTDIYHQSVLRGEGSLALSNRYETTGGAVRVYYNHGNHFVDDPNHFHSLDDRFGILAYQNFRPWTDANATVGFDFATYTGKIPMSGGHAYGDGSTQARMQTISRKSITEYSPYITLMQGFLQDRLTLSAGLRMANSDKFGTHLLPQFGLALTPAEGWSLKASLAKGYRNPSFKEMYLYRTANAELDPEKMMNYEVTLEKRFSRFIQLSLTGYLSKGSNLIQAVSVNAAEGGTTQRNMNTGSFLNKGIEVTAQSHPCYALTLKASYSYLHTSLSDLTGAPKNQYFLGVGWRALPRVLLNANLQGIGGLYVADDVKHQDYALLNLRLTYEAMETVELFGQFNNLTSSHYQINKGYEMPGFNFSGGVKWRF